MQVELTRNSWKTERTLNNVSQITPDVGSILWNAKYLVLNALLIYIYWVDELYYNINCELFDVFLNFNYNYNVVNSWLSIVMGTQTAETNKIHKFSPYFPFFHTRPLLALKNYLLPINTQ